MTRPRRILIWLAGLFLLYLLIEYATLPDVSVLKEKNPETTALMEIRAEEAQTAGRKPRRMQSWVAYARMSPSLKNAVLVGEDINFFSHHGFDVEEIRAAFRENWQKKRFARGASTITQQLAKNLYLSPSKNPIRKLKELLIARRLEGELSKGRIFELYLNVIEFGDGIYGVEAASRAYFGTSASALSLDEAALLAATIPNPLHTNPSRPTRGLRWRQSLILKRLEWYGARSDPSARPPVTIPADSLSEFGTEEAPPTETPAAPDSATTDER